MYGWCAPGRPARQAAGPPQQPGRTIPLTVGDLSQLRALALQEEGGPPGPHRSTSHHVSGWTTTAPNRRGPARAYARCSLSQAARPPPTGLMTNSAFSLTATWKNSRCLRSRGERPESGAAGAAAAAGSLRLRFFAGLASPAAGASASAGASAASAVAAAGGGACSSAAAPGLSPASDIVVVLR